MAHAQMAELSPVWDEPPSASAKRVAIPTPFRTKPNKEPKFKLNPQSLPRVSVSRGCTGEPFLILGIKNSKQYL
jgi:hypothetical protein